LREGHYLFIGEIYFFTLEFCLTGKTRQHFFVAASGNLEDLWIRLKSALSSQSAEKSKI
jgi:hypothetical protein